MNKKCQTSEYIQLRLLSFYKSNVIIAKAVRQKLLFTVEGINIDRKTPAKYCERFQWDGFLSVTCLVVADRQHCFQERTHFDFINQRVKLEQNDELILMPIFAINMEQIIVYTKNCESAF